MSASQEKSFKALIKDLQSSKDFEVRKEAARKLAETKDPLVIEPLLAALSDHYEDVRCQVINSLIVIGDETITFRIVGLLSDPEPKVRTEALKALLQLKAVNTIPEIYLRTQDPDWGVRNWATKILHSFIEVIIKERPDIDIRMIIALLRTDDPTLLEKIENLFLSTEQQYLQQLLDALERSEAQQQVAICRILGKTGSSDVVFPMINIIRSRHKDVRKAVLQALGTINREEAISPLIRSLGDTNAEVRQEAVQALTRFKEAAVLPLVRALIMSRDSFIRRNAALTLGEIQDPRAISALIASLGDSYFTVRNAVEHALKKYGEVIVDRIIPLLDPVHYNLEIAYQLLDSPLANERLKGIELLRDFRDPHSVKTLQKFLDDPFPKVQENAQKALFKLGCFAWARTGAARLLGELRARQAGPVLIEALKDVDKDVRIEAARALGAIREDAAIPHLLPFLKDELADLRAVTAWVLGRFGKVESLPALIDALQDDDDKVRHNTIVALGKLLHPDAVVPLLRLISTSSYRQKEAIINAIKNIGKRALPVIMKSLEEKDEEIVTAIDHVLEFMKDDLSEEMLNEIVPHLSERQKKHFFKILGRNGPDLS